MTTQKDELQKLWQAESAPGRDDPGRANILPVIPGAGKAETERLRRHIRCDGWLKVGAILFLGAALPLFAGRSGPGFYGVLVFSLLAVALGIVQIVWSGSWREKNAARPLAQALAAELELWRRRRLLLAALLGATPALAWQVYQLAYLAMNPARSGRLVNILFLTAGGPLLWLLASWRQWARFETWLLQIEGALATFDEETAMRFELARKRSSRRTMVIVALLMLLLMAGVVLFWLAG